MVVYAKSRPPEDLKTHTCNLLNELRILRQICGDDIDKCLRAAHSQYFWDALELVVRYHDLGKLHTPFQNKIRKILKEDLILEKVKNEIPHNLLSPAFIKEAVQNFPEELHEAIYQAIAYHHDKEREAEIIVNQRKWNYIKEVIENDLTPNMVFLSDMQDIVKLPTKLSWTYPKKLLNRIRQDQGTIYKFYVLLKGLLHRLDHSASAHLSIEESHFGDSEHYVTSYLKSKGINEDSIWQKIAIPHREQNTVLIASTGIGKTEFAYLWLGKEKGFYTLPVRTSVNAMYERSKETFKTDLIGLLHSDNYFYQAEKEMAKETGQETSNSEGLLQSLQLIDISRQFAMPLTISTADQLFTAALKYKGYEKIYATLSYSKVIIDEVQSYNPDIVAIILKGLEEISNLGGRFCLMTATLPPIYQEYLTRIPNTTLLPSKILPDKKHRIKIMNDDLSNALKDIVNTFKTKSKVLVIVNTVKKAQLLYKQLKKYICLNNEDVPLNLLHSAYTFGDRRFKEDQILNPACIGIWITTQLVEVSLNIDFPVLFTELASIDALIQRMGRVLRFSKGTKDNPFIYQEDVPNVFIFTVATGLKKIYDQDIVENSLKALITHDDKLFGEADKQAVVQHIFSLSNLEGTNYLRKFEVSLKLLENGLEANNRTEAQRLFREISNITVIPVSVKERYNDEIDSALDVLEIKATKREDRIAALYTLRKYSLSIPAFRIKRKPQLLRSDLFMTTMGYSPELGLIPDKECENIL